MAELGSRGEKLCPPLAIRGSGSSAEVEHAEREHGFPVTAVSGESIPFDGFPVVAFYPVAVGIELPEQRHGLDVALVLDPARRDRECGEIITSLVCTVGEIGGVLPVRSGYLRGRRRARQRGRAAQCMWWRRHPLSVARPPRRRRRIRAHRRTRNRRQQQNPPRRERAVPPRPVRRQTRRREAQTTRPTMSLVPGWPATMAAGRRCCPARRT